MSKIMIEQPDGKLQDGTLFDAVERGRPEPFHQIGNLFLERGVAAAALQGPDIGEIRSHTTQNPGDYVQDHVWVVCLLSGGVIDAHGPKRLDPIIQLVQFVSRQMWQPVHDVVQVG